MSNKEPHIADFVGLSKWEPDHNYNETAKTIKRLKEVIANIGKAEKLSTEEDFEELTGIISDIAWEVRAIEDAIDIIEDYETIDFEKWYTEVEDRLSEEEKIAFEQEKIVHKLKGA